MHLHSQCRATFISTVWDLHVNTKCCEKSGLFDFFFFHPRPLSFWIIILQIFKFTADTRHPLTMSVTHLSYYWTNTTYTYILGCANRNMPTLLISPHKAANEWAHCQLSNELHKLCFLYFPPEDSHLYRFHMYFEKNTQELLLRLMGFSD